MTAAPSDRPKSIGATLLLEHPAEIDYRLMIERVGEALGIDPKLADQLAPGNAIVFPVSGDVVMGMRVDLPFPESLARQAQCAYWWPDALKDVARNTSHVMVFCPWSGFSRLDAHRRHLVLVRELVEQLPVIGILWGGNVVMPPHIFKGEFASMVKGAIPFSLWVLIQYSTQPNGSTLISTLGMDAFEHMEIETESTLPLDQTFDIVRKFGIHILANGAVVKDGDAFGLSAEQRIAVRHVRSFRPDVNEKVYWLELTGAPTVRKPKGFFSWFGSNSRH